MADSFIQLPADSTGKQLDTVLVNMGVGTTAVHREKVVVADPLSTSAFATVTSSAGLLTSLSSGTVSLSSQISVTATAGTNPWSSAPGFNVPVVSVSSGISQVLLPTISVAGFGPVTSSAGLVTNLSSGTVTLSSVHTVTATAATNPWSSAPGFNVPVVTVSSGPVQALQSGTWTIQTTAGTAINTSSAIGLPVFYAITPTSSVSGAAIAPVTSSAGLLASLSSGTVSLSSQISVTSTAATNPWSSAPGFNLPVVNVSSGLVQISGTPLVSVVGTSSAIATVTSSGGLSVSIISGAVGSTAVNILGTQGVIVVTVTSGTFASALVVWSTSTSGGGAGSTSVNVIGSGAFAPVTSSAGLLASLSSGTVSLSSQITVTATAATNPWSSAPGFNIPTVSVSSGLSQVSAIQVSPTSSVAGAGLLVITSSFGLITQSTQPITITSGTVTATAGTNPWSSAPGFNVPVVTVSSGLIQLSSQITVTATGPVTVTSGLISVTSGTITSTAATNPWSSAPGFNVPVVSVSSGLVQISGTATVLAASSGVTQILHAVTATSSSAGAGVSPVTSSAGLVVQATGPFGTVTVLSVSSGLVQLTVPTLISLGTTAAAPIAVLVTSSAGPVFSAGVNTAAGYGPVTSSAGRLSSLSSGTVTLSSAIGISSGTVTLSSVHTVTATAATNPWSSAPGFNVPVVSVSSGFVRAFPCGAVTTSGLTAYHAMSTGGAVATNVTTAPSALYGYSIFNSSAVPRTVKFYNSTAPTVGGSTANLLLSVQAPGSTGGGGANLTLPVGLFSSNGWSLIITAGMGDTDTGAPGTNDISIGMFYQT